MVQSFLQDRLSSTHKKAIEEMELLQSKTKEILFKVMSKDQSNIDHIIKISERIESQNLRLEELYTAGSCAL